MRIAVTIAWPNPYRSPFWIKRPAVLLVQWWCWARGHRWAREIDLHIHVALYCNTRVLICGRCGASRLKEQ